MLKLVKAVVGLALLGLVVAPALAFAQDAVQVVSFWDQYLTPGNVALGVTVLLGLLAGLVGNGEVRRRRVAKALYHAYQVVNDIDYELGPDDKTLDKPLAGLRAADDWMKANGWRALRPDEQVLARLQFQELHGAERQAVKIAAEAGASP